MGDPNRCNTQWQSPIGNSLFLGLPLHHIYIYAYIVSYYHTDHTWQDCLRLFEVCLGLAMRLKQQKHRNWIWPARMQVVTLQEWEMGHVSHSKLGFWNNKKKKLNKHDERLTIGNAVEGSFYVPHFKGKPWIGVGVLDFRAQISLRGLLKSRTASTLTSKWNLYIINGTLPM